MRLKRIIGVSACIVLVLVAITTAASALTITGDNLATVPSTGINYYVYTVTGTGFNIGAQVWVKSPTGVTYQVQETAWAMDGTMIRGYLTIPASAAPGSYSTYVRNAGSSVSWYRTGMFTKLSTLPTITNDNIVTVPSGGISNYMYYVYGTGFRVGAQVWVRSPAGATYQVQEVAYEAGGTYIRGYLSVPSSAAAGSYTVYVQNPGVAAVYRTGMFTKLGAAPTITGVSPTSVSASGGTGYMLVYGTNFVNGAQVRYVGPGGYTIQTTETFVSTTQLRCYLTVPSSAPGGTYTVYVTNPNGQYASRTAFTKLGAAPTITSVSPTTVSSAGGTGNMYVYGTNFVNGAQVRYVGPGGYTVQTTETFVSTTQLRCYLTVPSSAPSGTYTVYVTNPNGQYASRTAFTKLGGAVTITGDSLVTVPASGVSGITYYVYGTNFQSGAQVMVRSPAGSYYNTYGETTVGTTLIRCTLSIPSVAAAGSYAVYVQNPGQAAVYRTGMFTKVSNVPASINYFSPNYATRGVAKTVYVYGANFQPGAQVIIYKGGQTAIQASGETVISSTTIRCTIYVPTSQPNGYYYGGVINPGLGFPPKANAFYLY